MYPVLTPTTTQVDPQIGTTGSPVSSQAGSKVDPKSKTSKKTKKRKHPWKPPKLMLPTASPKITLAIPEDADRRPQWYGFDLGPDGLVNFVKEYVPKKKWDWMPDGRMMQLALRVLRRISNYPAELQFGFYDGKTKETAGEGDTVRILALCHSDRHYSKRRPTVNQVRFLGLLLHKEPQWFSDSGYEEACYE